MSLMQGTLSISRHPRSIDGRCCRVRAPLSQHNLWACAQLVEDLPGVSLALSLHAPNQTLRAQIVPSARAYKLDKLMAAVDTYSARTGQKARTQPSLDFCPSL